MSTWNRLRRLLEDMAPWNMNDRIRQLERDMATTAEVVEQLNEATNELGDGVRRNAEVTDRVATTLEQLRNQVAGLDSSIADQLTPLVDELRGSSTELSATSDRLGVLAADPEQPVPPAEPTPETPQFR